MYMPSIVNRYETEIRLGLVVIVALLLLMNISSNFILHQLKKSLTEEIDSQLTAALNLASVYLVKSGQINLSDDQRRLIRQRFDVSIIDILGVGEVNKTLAVNQSRDNSGSPINIPRLTERDFEQLATGKMLFLSPGDKSGRRLGLTRVNLVGYGDCLVIAQAESWILASLSSSVRKTLYIAIIILVLIIPLTIIMPRLILKPFHKMRATAESAGRLDKLGDGDEVSEVIGSYEKIVEELKRNESELKRLYRDSSSEANQLRKFNRYILKSISTGVITVDLTGKVVGCNRSAKSILKYDDAEVLGRHFMVAFPQAVEFCLLIEAGLERGEAVSRRDIMLSREFGSETWLGVESSLILNDNDRIVGVSILFNDKTEFKKLQAELEMNQKMAALGEMTAGLAHQLRNSMGAVSGFCQLLSKKAGVNTRFSEIAESIRSEAATSELMLSRFLDFSRPLKLNISTFDLVDLIAACIDKYLFKAGNRGIEISFKHSNRGATFTGDFLLLKEALNNLIANSIQAMDSGGQIEVALENLDTGVRLVISDNGPGIADNIADKLFAPFFSSRPSGTGLGLALTRKIVNLHGGSISFEQHRSSGAVCTVYLPAKKLHAEVV